MEITIHEEKITHFTFQGEKNITITSHENTLNHPLNWADCLTRSTETLSQPTAVPDLRDLQISITSCSETESKNNDSKKLPDKKER